MKNKKLAKMAVALNMCEILHLKGKFHLSSFETLDYVYFFSFLIFIVCLCALFRGFAVLCHKGCIYNKGKQLLVFTLSRSLHFSSRITETIAVLDSIQPSIR